MVKKSCWLFSIIFVAITFLLAGCSSSWRYARPAPTAIGTGAIGHCLAQHQQLVERIQAGGVQIVQVGDTLTLLLPTDRFFGDNTPVLNRNYYPVLNQIAALLRSFDKFSIKVAGYTDNRGWPLRNIALSRSQAFAIANYLWTQGIDTRVMSSIGYGDAMPIGDNNTDVGRALNRRVEISLRMIADSDDI